jgi:hypothetical protein
MKMQLDTRPKGVRPGLSKRLNDAAAHQRALRAMGVEVPLQDLQQLPPGGWLRFVPGRAGRESAAS